LLVIPAGDSLNSPHHLHSRERGVFTSRRSAHPVSLEVGGLKSLDDRRCAPLCSASRVRVDDDSCSKLPYPAGSSERAFAWPASPSLRGLADSARPWRWPVGSSIWITRPCCQA